MKIFSGAELNRLLPYPDLMQALQESFAGFRTQGWIIPQRSVVETKDGTMITMPAADRSHLGIKVVTVFKGNADKGLPVVQALYMLFDAATGTALAQLDGDTLTALRTAATSALASKFLARKDASVLSIFGAGVQARAHISALLQTQPAVRKVFICSRTQQRARRLLAEMVEDERSRQQSESLASRGSDPWPIRMRPIAAFSESDIQYEVTDAETAVLQADILCTCTTSTTPVFRGAWLKPGAHINAIGAFQPATREIDDETVRGARIFMEIRESVMAEAGDLLIPLGAGIISERDILGDLPALASGAAPGRKTSDEITLFKSTGHALEDLTAAKMAFKSAVTGA